MNNQVATAMAPMGQSLIVDFSVRPRTTFIDTLRVALTALVVFQHAAITYGATSPADSWYWFQPGASPSRTLTIFCVINQAFFMGFFFMIAGYFIPASFARKGQWWFISNRLLRLGLPLLVFGFLLHPLSVALGQATSAEAIFALWFGMMTHGLFGSGPLWFVQTLLVFSLAYVFWRPLPRPNAETVRAFPGHRALFVSALAVGASAFLLRLVFPLDTTVSNLSFGSFASYIFLFVVGVTAARSKWLERVPSRMVIPWLPISVVSLIMLLVSTQFGNLGDYDGGWTIHAAVYAFFEPFCAWGIILALLRLFQSRFNVPSRVTRFLSARAYSVYGIHTPLLVVCCRLLSHWNSPVLVKFVVAGSLGCVTSIAAASLLLLVPGARRVLG